MNIPSVMPRLLNQTIVASQLNPDFTVRLIRQYPDESSKIKKEGDHERPFVNVLRKAAVKDC